MTPLEMIKNGVQNDDLSLVAQGYELMTGEKIEGLDQEKEGETEVYTNEKPSFTKQTLAEPKEDFHMQIRSNKNRTQIGDDGEVKTFTRSEPIDTKKIRIVGNLFSDDKTEATKELGATKKLQIKPPVPREREKVDIKTVTKNCEECGKPRVVSSTYITKGMRFVCDSCIKKKVKGR